MEPLQRAASTLSHPWEPGRGAVIGAVLEAHTATVVDAACATDDFETRCDGLLQTIGSVVGDERGAWSPPFGAFEAAARARDRDAIVAAGAQLAVWAHDHGVSGQWRASFSAPVTFRLGQTAVVQLVSAAVDASCDGYEIAGTTPSGAWQCWLVSRSMQDGPLLRTCRIGRRRVRVSSPADLQAIAGAEFLTGENWQLSRDLDRAAAELAEADAWFERFSPDYVAWVDEVLRQVLFTAPGEGLMESGSSRALPGFVHVSHGDPVRLMEMLVHELSHQHYYVATRLGPVDDGTDVESYWSPVKEAERPIGNILLAYHAFGNVALLLGQLVSAGAEPEQDILANRADVHDQLSQLLVPLESTSALTDVGRGLFEPLRDRLAREGLP